MPIYVYDCPGCQRADEILHSIAECDQPTPHTAGQVACPGCGEPRHRVPQLPAYGVIASMTPHQRKAVISQRSKDHFKKEGAERRQHMLEEFKKTGKN